MPDHVFLLLFSKGNQRRSQRSLCQLILLHSSKFQDLDHHVFSCQHISLERFCCNFLFFCFKFTLLTSTSLRLLSLRAAVGDVSMEKAAELSSQAPVPLAESLSTAQCITQIYRKSLRLTSPQIVSVGVHMHVCGGRDASRCL